MALIWAESFGLYGTSTAELALRGYVIQDVALVTTNPRTGTHCLQFHDNDDGNGIGRNISPVDICGTGAGICSTENAASADQEQGIAIGDATSYGIVRVTFNNSLGFDVWHSGVLVASSDPNLWALNAWNWMEIKVVRNSGGINTGTIEVRLNGETIVTVTGRNFVNQWSRVSLGQFGSAGNSVGAARMDDWIIWDGTGDHNNDFMGERHCIQSMPDADTAEADWTPSSGVDGYAMIDETTPNDLDYIQAGTAGDISEFEKAPVGIDTNDVAGVVLIARAWKTDVGDSTMRLGVHSGAVVENGPEIFLGTTPVYEQEIFERNPNGDVAWTRATVDAATIRATREV